MATTAAERRAAHHKRQQEKKNERAGAPIATEGSADSEPDRKPRDPALEGKSVMPHTDPPEEIKPLDVPVLLSSTVKIQDGKLVVKWNEVEGATRYELEVRRGPGYAHTGNRTSEKTTTEFKNYPLGPPGVPQVRLRALAEGAISPYTNWHPSSHDTGEVL